MGTLSISFTSNTVNSTTTYDVAEENVPSTVGYARSATLNLEGKGGTDSRTDSQAMAAWADLTAATLAGKANVWKRNTIAQTAVQVALANVVAVVATPTTVALDNAQPVAVSDVVVDSPAPVDQGVQVSNSSPQVSNSSPQ